MLIDRCVFNLTRPNTTFTPKTNIYTQDRTAETKKNLYFAAADHHVCVCCVYVSDAFVCVTMSKARLSSGYLVCSLHTYTWLSISLCIMHWYYQNRLQRQTRKYAIICMVTTVNQVCSFPEYDPEFTKGWFLNMLLCKLYMHDSASTWICMRWLEGTCVCCSCPLAQYFLLL